MPTYEFTCPDGHDFDKFFRSMASAPTVMPCPVCGKPADRLVSAGAGLVFHGSGFYITDYGKDGKKDQRAAAGQATDAHPHHHSATGDHEKSDPGPKSADSKPDRSSTTSSSSEAKSADSGTAPSPAPPVKAAAPKAAAPKPTAPKASE